MSIHVPDELRKQLERRAASNGFSSPELYIEAMVRADMAGGPITNDERLETLLLERLDGPLVDVDTADFAQMRHKLDTRLRGSVQGPRK